MNNVGEREVYPHSLSIENYKHGEDFDTWVTRFELAVGLAYNANSEDKAAKRKEQCVNWLPMKIDAATFTLYQGITAATWDNIKRELSRLLTDPQERYDWFAGRKPIMWDGKESFHSLAMRIKLKIDKHIEEAARPREYFQQFRGALPKEYRKAIDLGCGDRWDVEEAKKIATRLRLADGDAAASAPEEKTVAFTGAAMADDRIKSVELALQGITVKVDNLCEKMEKSQRSRESSYSRDRSERDHDDRRSHSRGRDDRGRRDSRDRRDSYDRDRRSSYDGRRGGDRYRSLDYRDSSEERSRRDYYERDRFDRDRYDRRPSYERRPSFDRRRSYDRYSRYDRSPSYSRYSDRQSRYDRRSPSHRRYEESRYSRERDDSRDRGPRDQWRDRGRREGRDRDEKSYGYQDDPPRKALAIENPSSSTTQTTSVVDPQMQMLAATFQKCLRADKQEN